MEKFYKNKREFINKTLCIKKMDSNDRTSDFLKVPYVVVQKGEEPKKRSQKFNTTKSGYEGSR